MAAERTLVIGAGPAGLATAAALQAREIPVHHVDRTGAVGGAYSRIHEALQLASPAALIGLPGVPFAASAAYIQVREYRDYLRCYAEVWKLAPEPLSVQRVGYRGRHSFRVAMSGTDVGAGVTCANYHSVVVATGMYDHRIRPDIPGLPADGPATPERPAVGHAAEWRGAGDLRGRRVLVIGGATSAVEIAEDCASAGGQVVVSTLSGQVATWPSRILGVDPNALLLRAGVRLPRWFTGRACEYGFTAPGTDHRFSALRARGLIDVRGRALRFEGRRAVFAASAGRGGSESSFDRVVLATGYRHATPFSSVEVARTAAGHPRCHRGQSVSHPGLYFVGFPCAHNLTSQYLHGMARDSERVADAIARSY